MALSDDGKMVDKKEAPSAWKQLPAANVEEDLGEEWPLLPGAAAKKAPSSAAPVAQIEVPCKETLGASSSRHRDRAPPVPDRRAAFPSSSSSSPMHAPNNHMNGAAFWGRQNGRPHGRGGGGGYNRRPVGGGNVRGDTNVRVPHGRGRPNGGHGPVRHRPSGLPMHSQPPPLMAMPAPPMMPYFDPYMGNEFAYGFPFTLLLENELPFMPYPLPMYPQHGAAAVHQQVDAPPPPPTAEELQQAIRTQIEYYFSATNLVQDTYLRQQMDENGWVPLTLIANFYRVKAQTTDMDVITASILPSDEVEVQDGKIRKRTGWEQYLNPGGN